MRNACSRRLPDIETEVVPVGLVYTIQYFKGTTLKAMQFDNLLTGEFSNVNNMAIGKNHKMPRAIRVEIQRDCKQFGTVNI
jgi:hypothetical protein